MLIVVIKVDAPPGQAQGVKEHLAMCLEKFGDVRVVEVREELPEQTVLYGSNAGGRKP